MTLSSPLTLKVWRPHLYYHSFLKKDIRNMTSSRCIGLNSYQSKQNLWVWTLRPGLCWGNRGCRSVGGKRRNSIPYQLRQEGRQVRERLLWDLKCKGRRRAELRVTSGKSWFTSYVWNNSVHCLIIIIKRLLIIHYMKVVLLMVFNLDTSSDIIVFILQSLKLKLTSLMYLPQVPKANKHRSWHQSPHL